MDIEYIKEIKWYDGDKWYRWEVEHSSYEENITETMRNLKDLIADSYADLDKLKIEFITDSETVHRDEYKDYYKLTDREMEKI